MLFSKGRAHRGIARRLAMDRHDSARPVRILVAEDNPQVRAALRTFVSAHPGFEIVGEAADSFAALQLARVHRPDVALVDVLLPDVGDGLRVLRTLTELGVPAVAFSISSGVGGRALAAGAYRFLEKDGSSERLTAALGAAAASRA
jgi:DNA-binding NarL/FixJ family response regulator